MVMFPLLAVALACTPGDPEEQTGKSANGKYTLRSSVAGKLTLLGAGNPKALGGWVWTCP